MSKVWFIRGKYDLWTLNGFPTSLVHIRRSFSIEVQGRLCARLSSSQFCIKAHVIVKHLCVQWIPFDRLLPKMIVPSEWIARTLQIFITTEPTISFNRRRRLNRCCTEYGLEEHIIHETSSHRDLHPIRLFPLFWAQEQRRSSRSDFNISFASPMNLHMRNSVTSNLQTVRTQFTVSLSPAPRPYPLQWPSASRGMMMISSVNYQPTVSPVRNLSRVRTSTNANHYGMWIPLRMWELTENHESYWGKYQIYFRGGGETIWSNSRFGIGQTDESTQQRQE